VSKGNPDPTLDSLDFRGSMVAENELYQETFIENHMLSLFNTHRNFEPKIPRCKQEQSGTAQHIQVEIIQHKYLLP
jgi:hypothetical protein